MNKKNQKGIALIFTLILIFVLSVMAVSLMFVSQSETWSSLNYRLMSQSRDGAEAGIYSAAGFIVNPSTYAEPGSPGGPISYNHGFSLFPVVYAGGTSGDPTSAYDITKSPVQYNGSPVILSANSSVASNYPAAVVQTKFNQSGFGYGSVAAGGTTVNYNTYATLLAMHSAFHPYGTPPGTQTTVQTWRLTSQGSVTGVRGAAVTVSASLEQHIVPTFNYAAYAVATGCDALQFGGGGTTDSYDSSNLTYKGGTLQTQPIDGNVGTNGNLTTGGSKTVINGSLSTPRTGTSTNKCDPSNIIAWTGSTGTVTGGLTQLPANFTPPTPTIPAPGTSDMLKLDKHWTCPTGAAAITGCSVDGTGNITLDAYGHGGTVSVQNISFSAGSNLILTAGTYNINSLSQAGNGTLTIDSTHGPVILNVAGNAVGGFDPTKSNVIDLTGNSVANASLNPMNLQINYAGSGSIKITGGSAAAAVLDAPNSTFAFSGGGNWYGALVVNNMTDLGGAAIHYDRELQNTAFVVGPWMLDSFSWKKY